MRKSSLGKLDAMRARWGSRGSRVVAVVGDPARPKLGASAADLAKLKGQVKHLFHLAAIYDLAADAESQEKANRTPEKHEPPPIVE